MLVSMTGYCSTTERVKLSGNRTVTLTVELKALNGRFFEVIAKLSGCLSHLELSITNLLQTKLLRGKIYLNVNFDKHDASLEQITVAMPVVEQYLASASMLKKKFKLDGSVSISDIMNFPSTMVIQDQPLTAQDEQKILNLLDRIADQLIKVRTQEGSRLEKDFLIMFARCAEKIQLVEKTFKIELEHHKATLADLLKQHPPTSTPNQHVEEMQLSLKKMDIHEEIVRFKSHLEAATSFLKSSEVEKGKRLDFILQELLRETNTMMAKSSAFAISTACIDIKVELEKAREQILNMV